MLESSSQPVVSRLSWGWEQGRLTSRGGDTNTLVLSFLAVVTGSVVVVLSVVVVVLLVVVDDVVVVVVVNVVVDFVVFVEDDVVKVDV